MQSPPEANFSELLSADAIKQRTLELGAQISDDYADSSIVTVGILKGSMVFLADLIRAIRVPLETEFMGISSYGDATKSSGIVQITTDLTSSIEGRHVLIVEDIVDTGLSMRYLVENLKTRNPKSLKICTLLHKPDNDRSQLPLDYVGFSIPDQFVVGYGLDFQGYFRNLPYIGVYRGED